MPATPEDQAKAIALSDHNLDSRSLKDISKRLAAGEKLQFNEQLTTESEEEELPPSYLTNPSRKPLVRLIVMAITLWTLGAAVGAAVAHFFQSKLE